MDFFEALGFKHYQGSQFQDDSELRKNYIDRIYDTYIDEDELQMCDKTVCKIADKLEPRSYTSREFINEIGKYLKTNAKKKNSLIESEKAKDLLNEFISEDERSARITIRTIDSFDGINRNQLLLDVDNFLSETLSDSDVSYTVSGLGVLYNNLLQSLFSSQIKTISLVFAAIFLMLLVLFRSFLNALFIIIVPAFSVGVVLSLMSIFNIPLDIMTITIASISVGMSVDYSIHFAWRYLQERKKSQENSEKETIYSTGRAILITGLTIIVGFLIFIFSNFNPTVLFGIFSALAIHVSMVMSFRFLPVLLNLNFK